MKTWACVALHYRLLDRPWSVNKKLSTVCQLIEFNTTFFQFEYKFLFMVTTDCDTHIKRRTIFPVSLVLNWLLTNFLLKYILQEVKSINNWTTILRQTRYRSIVIEDNTATFHMTCEIIFRRLFYEFPRGEVSYVCRGHCFRYVSITSIYFIYLVTNLENGSRYIKGTCPRGNWYIVSGNFLGNFLKTYMFYGISLLCTADVSLRRKCRVSGIVCQKS